MPLSVEGLGILADGAVAQESVPRSPSGWLAC